MKKVLIGFQSAFLLLFLGTLVSSFFIVDKIAENSKAIVTEKVVSGTKSKIALVEEAINSRIAEKILKPYQLEAIKAEISAYQEDPYQYISSLTLDSTQTQISSIEIDSKNSLTNKLLEKISSWKQSLKTYFELTFSGLIRDIRIFLLSNVIGLLIALVVSVKSEQIGKRALAISVIMSFAIAISALTYLNQNWLYTILLNSYAGYSYPIGIFLTSLWLGFEYFKERMHSN